MKWACYYNQQLTPYVLKGKCMYSGITCGLFPVISLTQKPGLLNYTIQLNPKLLENLEVGASVAIDGVCQTVVQIAGMEVSFQAIQETLDKTTIRLLQIESLVSVERSLCYGAEIGGHEVAGHVNGTATVVATVPSENNLCLTLQFPPEWVKFIFPKGFIAIDGSSLTVGEVDPKGTLNLHLIPETLRVTNFATKQVGDLVNIELDYRTQVIVSSVERVLSNMNIAPNVSK